MIVWGVHGPDAQNVMVQVSSGKQVRPFEPMRRARTRPRSSALVAVALESWGRLTSKNQVVIFKSSEVVTLFVV